MSAVRTGIIVLNYRGEQVLRTCLESLRKTVGPEDTVLIVDNGAETALIASIRAEFPEVETVSTEMNRGFAAGMNFGIQYLRSQGTFDAFWLMNNDARVAPEALSILKQAVITQGEKALYSPIIFSDPTTPPWFSGGRINFLRMRTEHHHTAPTSQSPYETEFLTGCALFIPRAAIEEIGLLDERFFLYYEDAEYSLRALRKGLKLWIIPQAHVFHSEESRQNRAKTYWLVRSGVEFFLRESRGIWKLWVNVYFPLRRLKNWLSSTFGSQAVANEVKRAYTDVSL